MSYWHSIKLYKVCDKTTYSPLTRRPTLMPTAVALRWRVKSHSVRKPGIDTGSTEAVRALANVCRPPERGIKQGIPLSLTAVHTNECNEAPTHPLQSSGSSTAKNVDERL